MVVGPLVAPGTHRLPALRPVRVAGLGRSAAPARCRPAAAVLAAAVATVTVLAALRGDPSLGGISTEIGLDEVAVTHRLWNLGPAAAALG